MAKLKDNINKEWNNYKKPTPPKWRKRGDISLLISFLLLVIDFIMTWAGDIPGLTEHQAFYLPKILALVGIFIKFWTNTKKTQDRNPNDTLEEEINI